MSDVSNTIKGAGAMLVAFAILGMPLSGCAGEPGNGTAVRVSEAGEAPAATPAGPAIPAGEGAHDPSPQLPRLPLIDPPAGPIGSEVELWMDGLQRETRFYIGFGTVQEHSILTGVDTDADGVLATAVSIPSGAQVSRSHYFFVADANQLPLSVSQAFLVTDDAGFAEIRGDVAAVEGECIILIGFEDERYALEGALADLSVGDRITVRGRVLPQGGSCEGGLGLAVQDGDIRHR
jgi:hypothetical protein